MIPTSPVRQGSLGDRVADELRRLVISGRLAAGSHLVEDVLAAQFDVSRGPIRDALRLLEAEGLLESRRRGVFVKGLTDEDVDELYSLRGSLESLALRLAMSRAAAADWDAADKFVDEMSRAADLGNPGDFARADLEFHSIFYRLSGHRRLISVWEQYRPTFGGILDITNAQDVDLHPAAEAHADLVTAARGGDVESAVTTLTEHLLGARSRLRGALHAARRSQR